MTFTVLEGVALALVVGATLLTTIGIYRAAPPHDREAERRQMRDERRRPEREDQ